MLGDVFVVITNCPKKHPLVSGCENYAAGGLIAKMDNANSRKVNTFITLTSLVSTVYLIV